VPYDSNRSGGDDAIKTLLWWALALTVSPLLIGLLADAVPGGRVLIPVLMALGALRLLLTVFNGGRAADHAIGRLAYDAITLPFRALAYALGLAFRAARPDRW
jgi:uncharacterized membrane protein